MGPTLFDSTKEECHKILRRMELETYGAVVSTLRAQGELNKDRRKLLEDLSVLMKISPERHKAEIRRAVNDEKLGRIAERLSGGVDTEWAWALEGRRVVPLMPRLVRPTLFTSLATSVGKAVTQNPRICLNQISTSNSDDSTSKYVRDPDDEDTLSPVMVPIASPDSSCHSNNNFESDFLDTPSEKSIQINTSDTEKKHELSKKCIIPVIPSSVKRSRSPSNQAVNFSVPLSKMRAVSPNCVRPQQKVVTSTPQPLPQPPPRGQVNTPVRPQHSPSVPPVATNAGKIRIRAPIIQTNAQRPSVSVRPPIPQYAQAQVTQVRPIISNAVKQVVQIRAAPLNPQQQQPTSQPKEVNTSRTVQTHTPVTVQTVPSVASTVGKQLPGKANVIVLHKNLPVAKTISSVTREADRAGPLNKGSYLSKTINTPTGTKVTFPSNVRIISVPSGANVVGSGANASGVNHAALAQKIVTTNAGTSAQKNVYVLELSNEAVGKSIILGDIMPASLISEVNGASSKTTSVAIHTKVNKEGKLDREAQNEEQNSSEEKDNRLKTLSLDSEGASHSYDFNYPTRENVEQNGEILQTATQIEIETESVIIDTPHLESSILDPQTGVLYTTTEEEHISQPSVEQSSVDIFSTAIASADINMEAAAYGSDDHAGSTRLILTDTYDSPSAKS